MAWTKEIPANPVVAVAGATGAVGREFLEVLHDLDFPASEVRALASSRSAGKKLPFKGCGQVPAGDLIVEEMTPASFEGVDIALFSAGAGVSKEMREAVVAAGAIMIDNSSAFRMDDDVPLVVPEVNAEDIKLHKGVIANPNCTTAIMLVAVAPLHRAKGLRRIVAATYQAASGAGAKGMHELIVQAREVLDGKAVNPVAFAHQIAFNLIPHIDAFKENGYTKEELKMLNESRKMLHLPELLVSCTCVRIPVLRAHSEALNLEFENDITPEEARAIIEAAPGVQLVDDPADKRYPMPLDATEKYDVLCGRIRQDISRNDKRGLDIFVSGDQVLKGAALNAVQIAELL